ncbi:MAG: glycosyltransferase, partial [Thermodesulfobacteriota bacterium]|nr:glycosyltransferase [Thermodesulfobacteriota bacterium]
MKYYYNSIKPVMLAYQVVTQHSTSRIRILQITAPVVFGGAERVLLNIGRLIDKSRFTISYCVFLNPNRKQNELYGTLTDIDRDVSVIRMFRKVNINVFDLVRIIRKTHPHILHTHGYRPDIVGLIASRITHTPIVSTVHGWTRTSRKVRVYEYIQRKIMRYVDAVIPVSKQINNDLITEKVMPSRMFRINNIIDYETCSMDPVINLRKEYNIGMKCPVVGTIGRLSLEKGHIHLLKAVPLLWKSYPDIKVVIVGTGDQEAGLKEYVRMN